ncbi:uncharacterized protein [Oscarella lobularis]|uniref:uncharacterized protein isoform X2 n=1 Tax=Oscarella lobularis TaxID=121494 RepID=UPI003313E09D
MADLVQGLSGLDEIICLDALKEIASRWNADVGILQNLLDSAQEVQAPSAGRGAVPNERQVSVNFSTRGQSLCGDVLQKIISCQGDDVVALRELSAAAMVIKPKSYSVFMKGNQKKTNVEDECYERDLLLFAENEVGRFWKQLGVRLGVSKDDLDGIEEQCLIRRKEPKEMAWEMLHKFAKWKGKQVASLPLLRSHLSEVTAKPASLVSGFSSLETRILYGRERELSQMSSFFWEGDTKNFAIKAISGRKVHVIVGVGGAGKTSLAEEYIRRHESAYRDGIFKFNTESYSSLFASLKRNLLAFQTANSDAREAKSYSSVAENATLFQNFLKNGPRSLIFFDNVTEADLLQDCLPDRRIPCHVIITTRAENLIDDPNFAHMTLNELQGEDAVHALLGWARQSLESFAEATRLEQDFAQRLALDPPVQGLPLALAHAGIYIRQSKMTFQDYWRLLDAKVKDLDPAALDMTKMLAYFHLSHLKEKFQENEIYSPCEIAKIDVSEFDVKPRDRKLLCQARDALLAKRHLYLTWELDIDYIKDRDEFQVAYLILQHCSLFSSQDIPKGVLREAAFYDDTNDELLESLFESGIQILESRSFLQRLRLNDGTEVFSMHHLVQSSVFHRLLGDVAQLEKMLVSAGKSLVKDLPSLRKLASNKGALKSDVLAFRLPHVYAVAHKLLDAGLGCCEATSDVVDYACRLSKEYAHFQTGKDLYEKRIRNYASSGSDMPKEERISCYYGLAQMCAMLHLFPEAATNALLATDQKSIDDLSDREIAYFYCEVLCVLGDVYRVQGQLKEAEQIFQSIVRACSTYPLPHHNLHQVYVYLGSLYYKEEKFTEQIEILNLALSFWPRNQIDQSLADCYLTYGQALFALSKCHEALQFFKKALETLEFLVPATDFRIADVRREISSTLTNLGQIDEAFAMSKESLSIARSALPPQNIKLHKFLSCHADSLNMVGKKREALDLEKEAVDLLRKSPPRAEMLRALILSLASVGRYLLDLGDKREAAIYFKEGVAFSTDLYHKDELDAGSLCSQETQLGSIYAELSLLPDALHCFENAFALLPNMDNDHQCVIPLIWNYFRCLVASKEFSKTDAMLLEAMQLYAQLPSGHPLLNLLNNLYIQLCLAASRK